MSNTSNSIQYKPIEVLHFDPENSRLPSTIDGHDEQEVLKWMLEDASIIELMMSIGEKNYFPGEALLVVPQGNSSTEYLVIEGNRRLTAVKLLLHPELAPVRKSAVSQASNEAKYKPTELPTLVFNRPEEILTYLGYRHITGVKAWGALAKAKYLNRLLEAFDEGEPREQYKALAKTIGSRTDYVARTLAGLSVYNKIVEEDFFDIRGLNEESIDFAVLTTALNYQNIPKFIGMESGQDSTLKNLDKPHLNELTSWMFEKNSEGKTRLGESRRLGDLNSVVGNEKALESFRNGAPLKNAVLLTEKPGVIFRTASIEAQTRLEIARDTIHLVEDLSESDSNLLFNIQKLARSLKSIVDDKLLDAD